MVTSIEGGRTLSESLREFPEIFSTVYTSMIRVGEESGRLGEILKDLTEMLRWQDELIAQARRAMLYPVFVGVIVLPAMVVLMVLLVPQLKNLLDLTGGEMPMHTRALLATSDFFVSYWYLVLAAPFVMAALIKGLAAASPGFRYLIDKLKLHLWVLGPILYKIKIARFAHYFALMYASGITVLDSIALSRHLVGNAVLNAALAEVHGQISDGGGISSSFAQSGLFPALVVRMLKVGENSGAMDKALLNVSYFYDRQVKEAIGGLATVLGPVLVLIIASLLGWIMISILPPIYAAVISLNI
jgi:type IV pilus assembly protein PilC